MVSFELTVARIVRLVFCQSFCTCYKLYGNKWNVCGVISVSYLLNEQKVINSNPEKHSIMDVSRI